MLNYKTLMVLGALLAGFALSACGDKDGGDDSGATTEVAR